MTDVTNLIEQLRAQWRSAGLTIRPGTSPERIRGFEDAYGVRVPHDLAEYFREVDGMNDAEVDDDVIRFWPLAEVKPATSELPQLDPTAYEGYFVFADYSMWAHAYAVRLSSPNGVIIVGPKVPIQIAPSFRAFLALYLGKSPALFGKGL